MGSPLQNAAKPHANFGESPTFRNQEIDVAIVVVIVIVDVEVEVEEEEVGHSQKVKMGEVLMGTKFQTNVID